MMTRVLYPLFAAALLVLPAHSAAPRKPPRQTYAVLWTQSPFTTKPVIETAERIEENPFEDWALGGVSSVGGRRLVRLFHRKEAGKQMTIDTGDPNSEFKVLEVLQDSVDYKKTVVKISKGGQTGSVTYDDKLMAGLKAANAKSQAQAAMKAKAMAAAAARSGKSNSKPKPRSGSTPSRQPRMRVIPQPKKK